MEIGRYCKWHRHGLESGFLSTICSNHPLIHYMHAEAPYFLGSGCSGLPNLERREIELGSNAKRLAGSAQKVRQESLTLMLL